MEAHGCLILFDVELMSVGHENNANVEYENNKNRRILCIYFLNGYNYKMEIWGFFNRKMIRL